MSDDARAEDAVARWMAAVDARGEAEPLRAALAPDAVVERFGFGSRAGDLVQTLTGYAEIGPWLALTPALVSITQDGPVTPSNEASTVELRYRVDAPDFVGGGLWRLTLADDGRIGRAQHVPDDLPDAIDEVEPGHAHAHDHG